MTETPSEKKRSPSPSSAHAAEAPTAAAASHIDTESVGATSTSDASHLDKVSATVHDEHLAAAAADEKSKHANTVDCEQLSSSDGDNDDDLAGQLVGHQAMELDPVEAARVLKKIDWHLMPALILGHGLVYYDKSILGSAVLFGMPEDLNLFVYSFSGGHITVDTSRLSWAVSLFFFGMMAGIYPMTFALQRYKVNITLGSIVWIWALICALTAAVKNYNGLWAQRFFLGFVESVIPTGFMMIVSSFYTQREQALRQGLWFSSTGIFTIIGASLSYGFAQIKNTPLHGWQYVYIMAGCLTFLFGIWCFFASASPVTARFLTPEERIVAVERLRHGQSGVRSEKVKWSQIKEALLDVKVWLIFFMMACAYTVNGVLVGFGPLLIEKMGWDQLDAILFQYPLGGVAFIFILLTGWAGSRFHNIRVWMMIASCLPVIAGCCMIWKSEWSDHAVVPVAGFALLGFFGPTVALILTMGMTNVAGGTKKSFMAANIYFAYCLGNVCGPQFVDGAQMADHYPMLFEAVISCYAITIVLGLIFTFICQRENARRDALQLDEADRARMAFKDLTDKQNMFFRYSL